MTSSPSKLVIAGMLLGSVLPVAAEDLHIRLLDPVGSTTSTVGQTVHAVVIAPTANGKLPAGLALEGVVREVSQSTPTKPAILWVTFRSLVPPGGSSQPINTRVQEVDNARETVDSQGRIIGINGSETLSSQADRGIGKIQQRYGAFAELLGAAKAAIVKPVDPEIQYPAGVELTLLLTKPFEGVLPKPLSPPLRPFSSENAVSEMVLHQPLRAFAANPPTPSDITNLLLIGTVQDVQVAFTKAGWWQSASLDRESKWETFRALVEDRGYREAPVSLLLLDQRPPDLTYEKSNDTFAARHHLRIWRRPGTFDNLPIWLVTATHDTGIVFSEENSTFIHKIDSHIDSERSKVINDLLDTGKVLSFELVSRRGIPSGWTNATGDPLLTDGRIAVLLLGGSAPPPVP